VLAWDFKKNKKINSAPSTLLRPEESSCDNEPYKMFSEGFRVAYNSITWAGKCRRLEEVTVCLNPQNTLNCNSMQTQIQLFLMNLDTVIVLPLQIFGHFAYVLVFVFVDTVSM
jgi:hypothetical protein